MSLLETVRLSQKAKLKLIQIKRRTGIDRWNVICRWAFCLSLSESLKPQEIDIKLDSNIEMTWRIFTGVGHEKLYLALLKHRCALDGLPINDDILAKYFRLHLHRGIAYLANTNKIKRLDSFQDILKTIKK